MLISSLWQFPAGSTSDYVLYECRRCGTTLDGMGDTCPYCGISNVVRFELR